MNTVDTAGKLRKADWCVLPVSQATCLRIIRQYHYARGGSNTAAYRHGLFRRDDVLCCLGVAQWIPPTRDAARASWDDDWHDVLALSRLAIAPDVPHNAASFLIGQSVRLIARDGRFRCLVTYADTWQNHTGAIYKATNWEEQGPTKPEARWVDPKTGALVSKYCGGVSRSRTEMEAHGYVYAGAYSTWKYRLILPPPRAKQTLFSGMEVTA